MSLIIKRICRIPDLSVISCLLLAVISISLSGCITREEGCLDPAAQNFSFEADRACDMCCIYPRLSVSLTQKWGSENFRITDTLYDVHQQPYFIRDLKYLISSFRWIDTEGNVYTADSNMITCGSELIFYTADLLLIDESQFTYVVDSIDIFPAIQSIDFMIGWDETFDCVDPDMENIPQILSSQSELWDADLMDRAAMRMILQLDVLQEVYDTIYIHTTIPFDLSYDQLFVIGQPQSFTLTVDYQQWMSNFDATQINTAQESILSGIHGSITRTP